VPERQESGRPTTLTIRTPPGYLFRRDVCSYGYFLLAPNRWDPERLVLHRPFELGGPGAWLMVRARIDQPGDSSGRPVRVRCDRRIDRGDAAVLRGQIVRMLNLEDAGVEAFHRSAKEFRRTGRGRLFRSPTLFEDVIKTVTSCNVAWTSTIRMNERLCAVVNPAFPRAAQLARRRPGTLRARCGVGYRDTRIVQLAGLFASGADEVAGLEDAARDDGEVYEQLLALPGIGPYAASNIMQLIGRYGHLPVDTETLRHARSVLGMDGDDRALREQVEEHYGRYGAHRFRAYWFELWADYERRRDAAWTWDPETTGKTFTAAALRDG
jgi:3-methyladenine DNA glycosylase/8-oxoguanine DNA glycosylase